MKLQLTFFALFACHSVHATYNPNWKSQSQSKSTKLSVQPSTKGLNIKVREVFLIDNELKWKETKLDYAFSQEVCEQLLEDTCNLAAFKILYKEKNNDEIKSTKHANTNGDLCVYCAGATPTKPRLNVKTYHFTNHHERSKANVLDFFGPRGLIELDQNNKKYKLLNLNEEDREIKLKQQQQKKELFQSLPPNKEQKKTQQISESGTKYFIEKNTNLLYEESNNTTKSTLATVNNLPGGAFGHSEQKFLTDLYYGNVHKNVEGAVRPRVKEELEFVLLSVASTNSACSNCFIALRSLLENRAFERKKTLKSTFMRYFFADKADASTPLHLIYTAIKFPSFRSSQIRQVSRKHSYKSLRLDLKDKSVSLFIHAVHQFRSQGNNLIEEEEKQRH